MRKKILGIMAVTLTASMMAAFLTGCGTQAKATDQEVVMEEEPIIVTDEENSEEVTIETEDEITETEEVIADDGETDAEATYTEHEYFFALDEQDDSTAEEIDMNMLKPDGNSFELKESVNLYSPDFKCIIGYSKPNINVYAVTSSEEWYCISFADETPEYQLVLAKAEDIVAASGIEGDTKADVIITEDNVKQTFAQLASEAKEKYELLDVPFDDMEYIEFSIPKDCENLENWVGQMYVINNMSNYSTYCIELQDTDYGDGYLNFKLYYANSN